MKVAFQTNQISVRGTEVAVYDYAHFNETLLNNESFVITKKTHIFPHDKLAVEKFRNRFGDRLYFYKDQSDLDSFLEKNDIKIFYAIKSGTNDGVMSRLPGVKNCMHCVFQYYQPHGDVYAYIANWLSVKMNNGNSPVVPHILDLPDIDDDLRKELNIPEDAVVLGRHGGNTSFSLPFAFDAMNDILSKRKDIYFLFLNTNKHCDRSNRRMLEHERIIHLPQTADLIQKTKFINTCDAMFHARINGECFPLSLGEFSIRNKPIITWTGKNVEKMYQHTYDTGAKELLKDNAIFYDDYIDLFSILETFQPQPDKEWNNYKEYTPENVMDIFKKVFLD